MLDQKKLRTELETIKNVLFEKRGYVIDVASISNLEEKRKGIQMETQSLQSMRNALSKKVGIMKAKSAATVDESDEINELIKQVNSICKQLSDKEKQLEFLQNELLKFYHVIPNIPHFSVPIGRDESDNVEIRKYGTPCTFNFEIRDHTDLGAKLQMMDFEIATKIAGARFVVMYEDIAMLHRALINFMLDVHVTEHEYREVYVPYLVNKNSLFGTAQLPKFYDDLFHIKGDNEFGLIPTAEIPVTNLARDVIFAEGDLPIKYVCHTPCFRSEAGSYGKDTNGMIRQHQFEKVELIRFEKPENSYAALEELTNHAEKILQKLELPYRVVALCGGDLGFAAAKTYDIEVWLPSQNKYREISSCSNCEDFQARRMMARFKRANQSNTELIHTLNGSGLAIGRTLIAIMENYQEADGSISIPTALLKYTRKNKINSTKSLKN